MNRLSILLLTIVVLGTQAQAKCHPKLTPEKYENQKEWWSEGIKREKNPETKVIMEEALKELDAAIEKLKTAIAGNKEIDQDTCRVINKRSEFLSFKTQQSDPNRPINPLERNVADVPDSEFFTWAMRGSMDGSVFSNFIGDENFEKRVLALSDNDFTRLMSELKMWHAGTPLMLLMYLLDSAAWGIKHGNIPGSVTDLKAYKMLNRFWDRIKKLDEQSRQKILRADYINMTLSDWLKQDENKRIRSLLPDDLRNAIDALPPSPRATYQTEKEEEKKLEGLKKMEEERKRKELQKNFTLP